MITSNAKRLMINGLGQASATRYKAPGGIKEGRWVVADGNGGGKLPACVFGVTETPYAVAYASAALTGLASYDLSGTVTPVGCTVHLSLVSGDAAVTPQTLSNGEFATVASNDEGAWSYPGLAGQDGTLYAWIVVDAAVLDTLDANVSSDMTVTVNQGVAENIQTVFISDFAPEDTILVYEGGGADYPDHIDYTITGTAPAGVEAVYLTPDKGDVTTLTSDVLTPLVAATATPDETGAFSFTYSDWLTGTTGNPPHTELHRLIIWCRTEETGLTAASTWEAKRCLSGDTLIAMADGSTKRLDEIKPGDLLLSEDGTPTRALRTARGLFNPYHTLYRFSDGTTIDEIHDHRFYNVEQGFWQLLRCWNIGEHARRQDGAEVALVSVERVDEPAEMFGLWTESRDYWANGLLSGETAANQTLLSDATAEQAAEMAASLEEQAILKLMGLEAILP